MLLCSFWYAVHHPDPAAIDTAEAGSFGLEDHAEESGGACDEVDRMRITPPRYTMAYA